jgi:Tat protein secretion system quality control protein TatD with DNase activity
MSLSTAINEKSVGHRALIAACPSDRILAESDIHDPSECAIRTWKMITIIANVKNWRIEETCVNDDKQPGVVQMLSRNWETFARRNVPLVANSLSHNSSELELASDEEEW